MTDLSQLEADLSGQVASASDLAELDRDLPLYDAQGLTDVVTRTMASTRMVLTTLMVFAAVAAVLATVGLYAVIAYVVRQRRKELAIRLALGATPASLGFGVLRDGMKLVAGGVAVGIVLAVGTAGVLSGLVVGVPVRDPLTLVGVSAMLLIAGAASAFIPARRAASVDPVSGLRDE